MYLLFLFNSCASVNCIKPFTMIIFCNSILQRINKSLDPAYFLGIFSRRWLFSAKNPRHFNFYSFTLYGARDCYK
jgi:hypothetical protein